MYLYISMSFGGGSGFFNIEESKNGLTDCPKSKMITWHLIWSQRISWRWLVGVALLFPFDTSTIHHPEALKSGSGGLSSVT